MISTRTKSHGILVSSRRGHTQPLGSMWTLPLSRQSSVPEALQLLAAAGADSVHAMALSGVPLPESPPARLSRKTARSPAAAATSEVKLRLPARSPLVSPDGTPGHTPMHTPPMSPGRGPSPELIAGAPPRPAQSPASRPPRQSSAGCTAAAYCTVCHAPRLAVCRDVMAPRTLKWHPSSALMRLHFLVVLTTECSSRCQPHSCCNAPRDLVHMLRRQA